MSDRLLQLLEDTALERTTRLAPSTDPVGRVDAAIRRDQVRRTRSAVASAALSVVVVLVMVLGGLPHLTADPVPPATTDPVFPAVVRTVSFDGLPWPVAGVLASDPTFVSDVELRMARAASAIQGGSASYDPTVLFAGDVGGTRVVVARDSEGMVWVAHGLRGASVDSLEGMDQTYVLLSGLSPIGVLMPRVGEGADLLVLTPGTVRAAVATAPALWPDNDPAFRTLDTEAGVTVAPLQPTTPFALDANTVFLRAAGTAATIEGTLVALDDPDTFVPQSGEVTSPTADPEEIGAINEAGQAASGSAGFGQEAEDFMEMGTASLPTGDASTSLWAAVVEVTAGGVRSRALAVRVNGPGGGMVGSTSSTPTRSSDDPRPLVQVLDDQDVVPGADGVVVWVEAAGGTIEYTYRPASGAALRTGHADVRADGFVWLAHRADVTVVSVRGADGVERWHTDAE